MLGKQRIHRRKHLSGLDRHVLRDVTWHLPGEVHHALVHSNLRQALSYMTTLNFRHINFSVWRLKI